MDFQVPATRERRGIPRAFLVMFGCVGLVALCCCGCFGLSVLAMGSGEGTVAAWAFVAVSDQDEEIGIVCKDSPAALFTDGLRALYGDTMSISVTNPVKVSGQDKTYEAEVTIEGETDTFWFVLGDDKGFLGLVGNCIFDIRPATTFDLPGGGLGPTPTDNG